MWQGSCLTVSLFYGGNSYFTTTNGVATKYRIDSNRLAQVIEERDGNDNLLVYYTYRNDLINQTRSGVTSYFQYDGLGSTRRLTDEDGNVTDTYVYDAFGNILNRTGTTQNSYMFAGEQYDANSGFYYLRARYMNPAMGNFITMDPYSGSLYDPTSLHKYLYANASPVNFIDPTGYFSIPEIMASFEIDSVISGIRCTALSALRNAAKFALAGALLGGKDAQLEGSSIVEGVLNGSISGAVFGALWTFSSLRQLLGIMCVEGGIEGVSAALEKKNYELAAWRATICILSIVSLKSELFNKSASFNNKGTIDTSGANRSAEWSSGWIKASLNKAISRHAGPNYTSWITDTGKIIYENPLTGRQVVVDQAGGYFRIFQPKSIGSTKGTYLNLLGNEVSPAFKSKGGIKNIKLINFGKDLWQQFTHFLIE